ncbi:conserved hypothetical protein [Ricinus communis]|uniref:Uncharacterized protein n=1 Tax=Ricinus communis TaxID=3988 RepID=B9TLW5_RICCO|nr:conserved hypothetical protein [Ricinus communis]
MRTRYGNQHRERYHAEHVEEPVTDGHGIAVAKRSDDGRSRHVAAIGIERHHRYLSEADNEVQHHRHGACRAEPDHELHLASREGGTGERRCEDAERHGCLRADHRAERCGQKNPDARRAGRKITCVVGHIGPVRNLPGGRQRDGEHEMARDEVPLRKQAANVVMCQ